MKLPVPDVYLPVQGEEDVPVHSWEDGWMCGGTRSLCGARTKQLKTGAFTYGDLDDKMPGGESRVPAGCDAASAAPSPYVWESWCVAFLLYTCMLTRS